jgi:phosphohistidine phosphatase SixA
VGIAFVGHEPGLGELATYLLTGVKGSIFRFKKGGVACVEVYNLTAPPHCQLRWLLAPKQLAAIARGW